MAVKSKVKPQAKIKTKTTVKSKSAVKEKSLKQSSRSNVKSKPTKRKLMTKTDVKKSAAKLATKPEGKATTGMEISGFEKTSVKLSVKPVSMAKPIPTTVVKRVVNPLVERRRPIKRSTRVNQFAFMKAPGIEHAFEVGDTVEVFCDHEKNRERIRGWVKGIVVQVDHKMVAVQFRSNVYLTDGWMVPDRILWYPVNSEHIRAVAGKKAAIAKKDFIPEY